MLVDLIVVPSARVELADARSPPRVTDVLSPSGVVVVTDRLPPPMLVTVVVIPVLSVEVIEAGSLLVFLSGLFTARS